MPERHRGVGVKGGPGRPAGTAAQWRPLTTTGTTATTMDVAPPRGRGLASQTAARSAAHSLLFRDTLRVSVMRALGVGTGWDRRSRGRADFMAFSFHGLGVPGD